MLFRKFKTSMVTFCMITVLVFSPFAFSQSASDYFKKGVEAAEAGDFRAALLQYQKAKESGMEAAVLKYNFAVANYKLGQFEEAKKNFTELANNPRFKRIAFYNLGLVANKQKNKSSAVRWFRRAYNSGAHSAANSGRIDGNDKEIKAMAAEALKRLGAPLRKKYRANKSWKGYLFASMVSDDNVTLVNEDLAGVSGLSDTSATLSAYGAKWLTGRESGGVRLFLDAYSQNYSTLSSYNYDRLNIGLARYDYMGKWRLRYGGVWGESYYGGNEYQRLLSVDLRGRKSLSKNKQLRLRYKATQIRTKNPAFDYLDGWRQQFRIGSRIKTGVDRYRIYYQLELNDRQDFVGTSPIFTSFSATRHIVRVTGWWKFPGAWIVRLDGRYRVSEYNDDNILAGNIAEHREDTQTRISALLIKKFSHKWQAEIKYTDFDNKSSIDIESYSRSQIRLGVKRKF